MDTFRHDLRFALRLLAKDRAYALAVILTLALCLGANAAVFAVVQSVLIRPLPYPDADRIVFTYDAFPGAGVERAGASVPNHYDRRAMTDVFESLALYQFGGVRVGEGKTAEGVGSMTVTPSFFRVLRATAARGRLFTEADGEVGREHVAVLAYAFAARQPAGIDHVVGTTLRLNNEVYTVVGVLPQNFTFLNPEEQVWMPAAFKPEDRAEDQRYSQNNDEIGRLASGVTVQQAQARLNTFNATLLDRAGSLKQELINVGYATRIARLQDDIVRNVRPALTLLWCGVLVVLLIAGVNLTNLALVRASGRFKELTTRHALGASNGRVARQLATETVLLTVIGGALGIVMGTWCIDSLQAIGLSDVPRAYGSGWTQRSWRLRSAWRSRSASLWASFPRCSSPGPTSTPFCARRAAPVPPDVGRATRAAPSSWRKSRSRSSCSRVRACCWRVSNGSWAWTRVQGLGRVDGPRKPARGPVSGRCSVEVLRDARAATNPCPAGRRGGRHDELPAVRVGQFEQRDHR